MITYVLMLLAVDAIKVIFSPKVTLCSVKLSTAKIEVFQLLSKHSSVTEN